MIRGKFFAQDDFDLAKHHLLNWDYLDDIPHADAEDGQVIARVAGNVVWADLAAGGIVSVDWDDITGKPSTFPPDSHGHPWDAITDKPTFVNSLTTGEGIQISSQTGDVTIEDSYHFDNNDPNGFVNTTDSSFTLDSSNLLFTIDAVSPTDGYGFYVKGKKFLYTESHSVSINELEGIQAVYFNENGTLTRVAAPLPDDVFTEKALVAIFRWDDDNSEAIYVGEERHGIIMDGRTHQYLHDSEGTRYISGMALGNISSDENGASDAHATLSVGGGTIADEDLFLDASATASTYADWYTFSKTDAGDWRRTATGSVPVRLTAGVTATYNELNGTTWQQTQLSNNQYVLAHIFRTNSITRPFISVQGEDVYSNQAAARAGATAELLALYTDGMPFVEFSPLGTVIYQYSSVYGNSVNLRIRTTDTGDDYVDWRQANLQASGSGPSDHGSLSGLADSDHPLSALQQGTAVAGDGIILVGTTWTATAMTGADVDLPLVENQQSVKRASSSFTDDFTETTTPPTTSYVLVQASAGSMRYSSLGNLPISTATQSEIDAQALLTQSWTNITDWADVDTTINRLVISPNGCWAAGTVRGGHLQSAGHVYVNYDGPDGNSLVYFYEGSSATGAYLRWNNATNHFDFSHDVDIAGLAVSGTAAFSGDVTGIPLSALEQGGATTGQVPTWNATTSEFEPADIPAGGYTPNNIPKMIYVENPTATDALPMFTVSVTSTIEKVLFGTDAGTVTFNLEERAGGTPGTAGTDVFTTDITAGTTHGSTSTFNNTGLAAESWVYLVCSAVSGSPTELWVRVFYSED